MSRILDPSIPTFRNSVDESLELVIYCESMNPMSLPINAENHQQIGGQDVAASPHHHQHLAGEVVCVPL